MIAIMNIVVRYYHGSLPGTGFQPSEGIHNFIPSSDDSLDNIRFAKSNPVDDAPHGSRIGQISKSHLMSNKKALADRYVYTSIAPCYRERDSISY